MRFFFGQVELFYGTKAHFFGTPYIHLSCLFVSNSSSIWTRLRKHVSGYSQQIRQKNLSHEDKTCGSGAADENPGRDGSSSAARDKGRGKGITIVM